MKKIREVEKLINSYDDADERVKEECLKEAQMKIMAFLGLTLFAFLAAIIVIQISPEGIIVFIPPALFLLMAYVKIWDPESFPGYLFMHKKVVNEKVRESKNTIKKALQLTLSGTSPGEDETFKRAMEIIEE